MHGSPVRIRRSLRLRLSAQGLGIPFKEDFFALYFARDKDFIFGLYNFQNESDFLLSSKSVTIIFYACLDHYVNFKIQSKFTVTQFLFSNWTVFLKPHYANKSFDANIATIVADPLKYPVFFFG